MTTQTPPTAEMTSDSGPGSGFSQIFDSGYGYGSERKTQNPVGSGATSGNFQCSGSGTKESDGSGHYHFLSVSEIQSFYIILSVL